MWEIESSSEMKKSYFMITIFFIELNRTVYMINILLCYFNNLNNVALCSPLDLKWLEMEMILILGEAIN